MGVFSSHRPKWRDFPAAASGIPYNSATNLTWGPSASEGILVVEIGFLQEKTYGLYGFTCGNDRTDTEREPRVRLGTACDLRVGFGFSLLGSASWSFWHRGCKIFWHEECGGLQGEFE